MASVVSVNLSKIHEFSKHPTNGIILLKGLGVKGDCHMGETVQHLSRMTAFGDTPNLRQVHLIHSELFTETQMDVQPGDMGENITTKGIDLLALGTGDRLVFYGPGDERRAAITITGLRNPCPQIDKFKDGLREKCVERDDDTKRVTKRKSGIMATVDEDGFIGVGDKIVVQSAEQFVELKVV